MAGEFRVYGFVYCNMFFSVFKALLSLHVLPVGELKTTKAYQKWAKLVSETKPPTDPLVKRGK